MNTDVSSIINKNSSIFIHVNMIWKQEPTMTEVSTFRCLKKATITIKAIIFGKIERVKARELGPYIGVYPIYHIFSILWICPIYGAHFVNKTDEIPERKLYATLENQADKKGKQKKEEAYT